jgi:DNA adenine methylase
MSVLRRLGNKARIAEKIIPYFPKHSFYLEPFMGAGGMFFAKPKARYNILNDLDDDVYNLFMVILNRKEELVDLFKKMPYSSSLLKYWKQNKETEEVRKAIRFLFLSNFTLYGKPNTVRYGTENSKSIFLSRIDKIFDFIQDVQFYNGDFRKFLKIFDKDTVNSNNSFIYCDPPYLGTDNNYSNSFTEQDSVDLFDCLEKTGVKWAMSEFNNDFIIEQAKSRNLKINYIGTRPNIKNRRTEVLITNYEPQKTLF